MFFHDFKTDIKCFTKAGFAVTYLYQLFAVLRFLIGRFPLRRGLLLSLNQAYHLRNIHNVDWVHFISVDQIN